MKTSTNYDRFEQALRDDQKIGNVGTRKMNASKLGHKNSTIDWERIRFTSAIALYGTSIGTAIILISLISTTVFFTDVPERPSAGTQLLFGFFGALAGCTATAPYIYLTYGEIPTFSVKRKRVPIKFWGWLLIGFGYMLAFPLIMGGFFLPFGTDIYDFIHGIISVPNIAIGTVDTIVLSPFSALAQAGRLFLPSLLGGILLAVGSWVIDRFHASTHQITAKYLPLALSVILSVAIIAFVILSPETTLKAFS